MTDIAIWENEKKVLTMAKEFIERKALLARYDAEHVGPPGRARELMATAPAADVTPVVHGRWIEDHDYLKCPECSVMVKCDFTFFDIGGWNYCPNCGAKMDKEE